MSSWFERLRDPSEKTLGVILLAPAFALFAPIVVYPIGKLFYNSFFDMRLSGGQGAKWIGWQNYADMIKGQRVLGRNVEHGADHHGDCTGGCWWVSARAAGQSAVQAAVAGSAGPAATVGLCRLPLPG